MNNISNKPKILHIDDNQDFLNIFSYTFKEWFDITSLRCCSEFFDKISFIDFDTIILDYEMPGMNGLDCLRKIKETDRDIPVIFYTGQGNEEIAREAFLLGVSDYFTKTLRGFALTEKIINSIHRAIEIRKERKERRETEEKYRTLVDLSPDPIVIIQDSKFQFINSAFTKLFGYTNEDIEKGINFYQLVMEKDRNTTIKILEARLSGKNILQKYIIDMITKTGEVINCEISNTTIDYQGKPALIKIIHNVTEQRRNRERVERYREQLSILGGNSYIRDKVFPRSKDESHHNEPEKQCLVNGKYSIKDLVDIEYLKRIMESFSTATGFTTGFVSHPDQEVLFGTGWRSICTKFHRVFPESEVHCIESNEILCEGLKELKEYSINECENGLIDGATPIIIEGAHIANLFAGQVFFKKPDILHFMKQGEMYGYDMELYLQALDEVPIVTEEQFKEILSFLCEMATLITKLGFSNLMARKNAQILAEEIAESKCIQKELMESEERYHQLLDAINDGLGVLNSTGIFIFANPRLLEMLGYELNEMQGHPVFDFFDRENRKIMKKQFSDRKEGSREVFEIEWIRKDGTKVKTVNSPQPIFDDKGEFKGSLTLIKNISDYNKPSFYLRYHRDSIFNGK